MKTLEIKVHEIAIDGLPNTDECLCRMAFLWDGNIVNGWPILPGTGILTDEEFEGWPYLWEADSDPTSGGVAVKNGKKLLFSGVTHWIEFPEKLHIISPPGMFVVGGDDDSKDSEPMYSRDASNAWRSGDQSRTINVYRP